MSKTHHRKGVKPHVKRYTFDEITEMKAMRASGRSTKEIASKFQCSITTVSRLTNVPSTTSRH